MFNWCNLLYSLQIRHIRQQEGSNSHAVQQGEVSSSNPNILSNDRVGPILLEVWIQFKFHQSILLLFPEFLLIEQRIALTRENGSQKIEFNST